MRAVASGHSGQEQHSFAHSLLIFFEFDFFAENSTDDEVGGVHILSEEHGTIQSRSEEPHERNDNDKGKEQAAELAAAADQAFAKAMGNDLGIAEALAAVYNLERSVNSALAKNEFGSEAGGIILEQFRRFNKVLGSFDVDAPAVKEEVPAEIMEMAQQRTEARKARDFAKADELRNRLKDLGWIIEDVPGGGIKVKKA